VSYNYICGNRTFSIETSSTVKAPPAWITFSTEKTEKNVGYQVKVVVYSISAADVGTTILLYCAELTNFVNKQCISFTVLIHDISYLTSNKPPWFEYE
jgi:hypothetical protein